MPFNRWIGVIVGLTTIITLLCAYTVRSHGTFAVLHRSGIYGTDWIGPWWYVLLLPVLSSVVALLGATNSTDQAFKRIQTILLVVVELTLLVASILIFVWNF